MTLPASTSHIYWWCGCRDRQTRVTYADDYDKLRQENLDLHAQISMLKSPEVCAAAHENVEECGYCQRDAAMESLANQQNATQLALARIEELERDQKLLLTLRDSYEMASNPPGGAEKCFKCATLETFILWMIERMKSLEDAR